MVLEPLYFPNHNILYKGQWTNNMSNGFGEEYDKNGVLLYKGYWMYNEKNI